METFSLRSSTYLHLVMPPKGIQRTSGHLLLSAARFDSDLSKFSICRNVVQQRSKRWSGSGGAAMATMLMIVDRGVRAKAAEVAATFGQGTPGDKS